MPKVSDVLKWMALTISFIPCEVEEESMIHYMVTIILFSDSCDLGEIHILVVLTLNFAFYAGYIC